MAHRIATFWKIYRIRALFFCSALLSVQIRAQLKKFSSDIQFIYEMKFRPDSTKAQYSTHLVTLYEDTQNQKSVFQDAQKYKIDSVITGEGISILPDRPLYAVNHVILKDQVNKKSIYTEFIGSNNLGYTEDISQLKWKLGTATKKILSYNCANANVEIFGRNFTAWYTMDIPIQDGPYKFAGLPGLIVELYDSSDSFIYKLIEVSKTEKNIYYKENFLTTERLKLRDAKINNLIKSAKRTLTLNPLEKK